MTCTTHHHACDCREAEFKTLKAENAKLRAALKDCIHLTYVSEAAQDDEWHETRDKCEAIAASAEPSEDTKGKE